MPRRNRVDPWGDLREVAPRGMFTGNRGCLVDDGETVVRHHVGNLWITCRTEFRGWRWPLARSRRWTPIFFLDDAVALAAGHRPCATCRRGDYRAYRDAVARALNAPSPPLARHLDQLLARERLQRGRGLDRAHQRIVWRAPIAALPDGAVVVAPGGNPQLLHGSRLLDFTFDGWRAAGEAPPDGTAVVLTPPTSAAALAHGFVPVLHPSAGSADASTQPGSARAWTSA